ncbi:hypothetical protein DQ04_11711000 [Trypanosoma grayi]|uniref:hypothetical protein n=1 Tax=Trypanosoma grayi TaxID=71804 RepID=UPI0004F42419|nr:hypothetical protein DQ04_11711000 [Trypanosoma grayi]KEG06900.1 hypothetical protein DQ04_11711000 [Trypanosoma grayi]
MPELSDPLSLREGQQRNCSSDSNAAALQSKGIRTPGLEFPRTPLAGEPACVRVSPPAGTSAGVVPVPASSSASFGGGDSIQWSTPLLPISPEFTNHHEQQHHHHQQQQQRSVCCASLGAGTSGISSVLCPPDIRDEGGGDNVRHLRVPFTDAEAMDEAAMLHLLRGSSSSDDDGNDNDDDDEEDAVYMRQQQQPHMFDVATVLPTNLDVYHCAGGYWDLEGPRAATRRFLRRSTPSIASFTLTANGGSSSARVVGNGAATDAGIDSDDDDDLWEMNSSAYADSLDEAQVEWIEQQLHAKENPEGFFF